MKVFLFLACAAIGFGQITSIPGPSPNPTGGAVGGASSVAVNQILYGASAGVATSISTFVRTATGVGIGTATPGVALDVTGSVRASQSITIGTTGTYQAGSIYSDPNWGMIFRAAVASPTSAEFKWVNSIDSELARITTAGNLGIATSNPIYKLDVGLSGASGTFRVKDQLATTGATSVLFDIGAGQTAASTIFTINGIQKFAGTNTTGAGTALLGANSPAVTNTAPYTWIRIVTSDGSTAFIPAWK